MVWVRFIYVIITLRCRIIELNFEKVYGSSLFPNQSTIDQTFKELTEHTDSFNAISPQMYSIGCDSDGSGGCVPKMISCSSDPGITPDPNLAKRFHALGEHIEYWPTLSSPDYLSGDGCNPDSCGSGPAMCPCGQAPNETATMEALILNPVPLIEDAIAEAKLHNITGYQLDMEAPAPFGDESLAVIQFVNLFSTMLAAHGVKTSYCIGGTTDQDTLAVLNQTKMRSISMGLYSQYSVDWASYLTLWQNNGMKDKLGIGFCPTCQPASQPEPNITGKFELAKDFQELDFFAFGAGYGAEFTHVFFYFLPIFILTI